MAHIPRVTIILINWNGLVDTHECLESLSKITYPHVQVLVVDNGSRNEEAAVLQAAFPWVTVIETGTNLGFTGGNNVGIKVALMQGAEYVLCLNNDTVVDPGFLEPLVQSLEDDPSAGISVSKIFYYDQPKEVWYAGAVCKLDTKTLAKKGGPAWHLSPEEQNTGSEPFETQIATGCVMLLRSELMQRLGGFDDRFFAYFEDVELSLRVEKMGAKRLVVPASRVWHKESRSTGGRMSPAVTFYLVRNACLLAELHAPARGRQYNRLHKAKSLSDAEKAIVRSNHNNYDADIERVCSIYHGIQCANQNHYGRWEKDPEFNSQIIDILLRKRKFYHDNIMPWINFWNSTIMRTYWYFNHHVLRKHLKQS